MSIVSTVSIANIIVCIRSIASVTRSMIKYFYTVELHLLQVQVQVQVQVQSG